MLGFGRRLPISPLDKLILQEASRGPEGQRQQNF